MRYYLDTNILVFLLTERARELTDEVRDIVSDYSNMLLTSSTCIFELIHLCQIGKLNKGKNAVNPEDIIEWADSKGITTVYPTRLHLMQLSHIPLHEDHRDPFDRLIIAQAISDRILLISSDGKFSRYERYGLEFVFNKR